MHLENVDRHRERERERERGGERRREMKRRLSTEDDRADRPSQKWMSKKKNK